VEPPSADASPPSSRPRAWAGTIAAGLIALAVALPAVAAGGSGGLSSTATPGAKAASESLTYDNFAQSGCSQAGFFTLAIAHLNIVGPVVIDGTTTLDGMIYDSYSHDLGTGPATFDTIFDRAFAPPPPGSSTYTFVFDSKARQGSREVGRSVTTISCANGAFSAFNVWIPWAEPVPTGHPGAWVALALLLTATGIARLRAGRA
jgi:hypothetical protein